MTNQALPYLHFLAKTPKNHLHSNVALPYDMSRMSNWSLGGNINADVLAGGIWEAMVTTAAGLTDGIFSLIFYNYFVSKIRKLAFEIETNSSELMDMLFSGEEGAIEA